MILRSSEQDRIYGGGDGVIRWFGVRSEGDGGSRFRLNGPILHITKLSQGTTREFLSGSRVLPGR
jgi:hypothetical protein